MTRSTNKSKFKYILNEYSKAFHKEHRLASEIMEKSMSAEVKLGQLPIFIRQHDFTTDYFLRTDGMTGWALYSSTQPQAPLLQFNFATREIFPGTDVQYNNEEEKHERIKYIQHKTAQSFSNSFIPKIKKSIDEANTLQIKKGRDARKLIKVKNFFDYLYVPEDEDMAIEEERIQTVRQKVSESVRTTGVTQDKSDQIQAEVSYLLGKDFRLEPRWIDSWLVELAAREIQERVSLGMAAVAGKKFKLHRELKQKINVYTSPDPEIYAVRSLQTESEGMRRKAMVSDVILPTKIKEFVNPRPKMWFGFEKNLSLDNLCYIAGVDLDILEIVDTTMIKTPDEYYKIHMALRKICSLTKTRQFLSFSRCYQGAMLRYGVKDRKLANLFNTLAPGFQLDVPSMSELMKDFCQITRSEKLFTKFINHADDWILGYADELMKYGYGF